MKFLRNDAVDAERAGFRLRDKGTHTSRTLMLDDLRTVLTSTPPEATRDEYVSAIINANCLGKPSFSTRRLTNQRLRELYALDPAIPIFRVLRRLWATDEPGQPLLALLVALARDPLLAASAYAVISLPAGTEFRRDPMKDAIRSVVGSRLNDATVDKVVRNAASSWTQSGHLEGRTFKRRRPVLPTPASVAFALYLGHTAGFRGDELLSSAWLTALDCPVPGARELALEAKRLGLIDLRMAGEAFELNLQRLDPWWGRT